MKKYSSILFALIAFTAQSQSLYFSDYDLLGKNDKVVTNVTFTGLVPTNRTITIGTQVGSLQSNLVFASSGGGVTEPTVTNIAKAVVDANVPTLAQSANAGGFAGTETITPLNIVMGGYWQALYGSGTSTIDQTAKGASQSGYNYGTQAIGGNAHGANQISYNGGSQTIGNYAYGASQRGGNYGTQAIGGNAYGASQSGYNEGTQTIGDSAHGAMQTGVLLPSSSAINNAEGTIQIYSLEAGQHALTTPDGAASLLVGAGTVSNKNTIVVGDGEYSHGVGSITAGGGFFGSGSGITIGGTNLQDAINQRVSTSTLTNYYTKAEIDTYSTAPYKAWTGTITPVNGTATVTYAHGNMPSLTITSPTYITLDPTGFASNGVSRVSLSIYSGTNSVTFNTNLITFATMPTISTNCWNSILIRRVANCIWKGVGL